MIQNISLKKHIYYFFALKKQFSLKKSTIQMSIWTSSLVSNKLNY